MTTRRSFLSGSLAGFAGFLAPDIIFGKHSGLSDEIIRDIPIVISTWEHGVPANEAAWMILRENGYSLDAVEAGVRVPEGDPKINTVGFGSFPDREGKVTLDASIMDERGRAGSVCFLEHIKHPISVARMVMEKTPHVMLCGSGALKFAEENGFSRENLLTPEMKAQWKKWKTEAGSFHPEINIEKTGPDNHDTIGMLAIDAKGRICGACTTSGLAFKMRGRVGDSPIIGAGLFVDGEIGGATATGTGELVMKTLGSFLVVELMRNGRSPAQACMEAVERIAGKIPDYRNHQIGYIALNKMGEAGAYCIQPGFNYAVKSASFSGLINAESLIK